jgi:hypothetical protein
MGAATDTLPGILAIFNNVAPGREAEFEEWFQHEHLAERIALPGFLIGRRHEAISGQPHFFNFYVTQSVEVLKSVAYLGRLDEPTPMTRTVMSEIFKDMIRTVCHRTFRTADSRSRRSDTASEPGATRTAIIVAVGTSSRNSSSRFAPSRAAKKLTPVTFPPGRLRLVTRPSLTGSLPVAKTIGTVVVTALAARAARTFPTITATGRRAKSVARAVN